MTSVVALESMNKLFGPWLAEKVGFEWLEGRGHCIGLLGNGKIQAVSMFEQYAETSIVIHCAIEGRLTREFIWFSFYHPFEQLKVSKIIAPVYSENLQAVRFLEHLGFTLEAALKDTSPKGDRLFYTLEKSACRWLSLRNIHGKAENSAAT